MTRSGKTAGKRVQSPSEERANALSHGLGLVLGIIGIPFLILKAWEQEDSKFLIGAIAFSMGILMVYGFSTAYHAAKDSRKKDRLQIMDHVSIYFLIAGSYTPMVLAILNTEKALLFLSIIWVSVLIGTFFKLFFTGKFKTLSVIIYLTMGWLAVLFFNDLVEKIPLETLIWIGAGGLSYTLGVFFYVKSNRPFFHTIWHVFVLGGTAAHFVAVYQLVSN
ncbi:hemolysin III family protein [Algoriphagus sp. CAU 1675]|uniref:PAQR family membrane homeostasis protein TrhA n=1 Tax=Algoriphagus sp. CAU 1675 TaxID=3032597 RepID=UPI0023DA3A0D|nr:hemolysin III family protein [Algoriphagus sp. CAU 1675]MDF2157484.1 hemolysin III family protein [Algoriphagus sp. CAU 1675]